METSVFATSFNGRFRVLSRSMIPTERCVWGVVPHGGLCGAAALLTAGAAWAQTAPFLPSPPCRWSDRRRATAARREHLEQVERKRSGVSGRWCTGLAATAQPSISLKLSQYTGPLLYSTCPLSEWSLKSNSIHICFSAGRMSAKGLGPAVTTPIEMSLKKILKMTLKCK